MNLWKVTNLKAAIRLTAIMALPLSLLAKQPEAPRSVTLAQAVELAIKNYPAVQVSREQVAAAAAGIQLARTAYLPRVDMLAQANRGTRNNTFGLLLPQSVIPSMSGPVIGSNNLGSVWGSAAGTLVSWEPFDFGLHGANVAVQRAATNQAQATMQKIEFDVAATAADAYLTLVACQETVKAAEAGVVRAATVLRTTGAQVDAELRPGADQSRALAEQAAARTQLIQARQSEQVARATLAQFTGLDPAQITTEREAMNQMPPKATAATPDRSANILTNPAVVAQAATVEEAQAQLRALERSYFPRFYLQGSAYARGSGAETDGARLGGLNGLAPTVQDYALGFTVTFPIMDFAALRAREAAQTATIRSETARSKQLAIDLQAQWNRAVANLNGARQVAENTPVQVSSARMAAQQAGARYEAGLGNIDDVAEAQRLLTQAEIDDMLARLGVWRGLLGVATAAGDIKPFVIEASK